jgi:hypothetical protein
MQNLVPFAHNLEILRNVRPHLCLPPSLAGQARERGGVESMLHSKRKEVNLSTIKVNCIGKRLTRGYT